MKVRKSFLALLIVGLLLPLADAAQRWVYVHRTPSLQPRLMSGPGSETTFSVLVAGAGLDEAETATGIRDLRLAQESILANYSGSHEIRTLHQGQADYSADKFRQALVDAKGCDRLVVYLTGHGGGFNFGATSRLNLKSTEIFEALKDVECREAIMIVDCCWSGRFSKDLKLVTMPYPITLITSTDADHPAPFPVSFLSPRSYGAMWFSRLSIGERPAFDQTNQWRGKLNSLYPENFGLVGTWYQAPAR